MIQRIQSAYLLLIIALLIAVCFLPLGAFVTASGSYEYTAFSINKGGLAVVNNFPVWVLGLLSIISAVFAFISIFLFKKRRIQIRLCKYNAFLLIGFYLAYACFIFIGLNKLKLSLDFHFGLSFPFIAFLLDLLAIRAIHKDDNLVKSWDRIR
jgi:hypothetical protein